MISVPLQELKKGIQTVQNKMKTLQSFDGISNFVLGLTGSAKSTLITSMLGGKIKYTKDGLKYIIQHVNNQNNQYPEIGNTNVSCTQIPSVYKSAGNTWYDPAGFLDTKGVKQEILNSYCNAKMFKKGCRARIILVVECSSLMAARGGNLVDAAKRLFQLFANDFQRIIYSCVLVVSKVALSQQNTEQDVIKQIKSITQSNQNLGVECTMLLRTIISEKKIVIYPTPPKMTDTIIEKIKRQISKTREFIIANDARISISYEAMTEVQKLSESVSLEINQATRSLEKQIYQNFIKQYTGVNQLQQNLLKIQQARKILEQGQIVNGNLNALRQLNQKLLLNRDIINKVYQLFDQVEFCQTIHTNLKAVNKTQDILLLAIKDCEATLSAQLQSITTKEQMKAITENHMRQLSQQDQRFREQQRLAREEAQKREKQLWNNLQEQNKRFDEKIAMMAQQHRAALSSLTAQLSQLQNQDSDGGWCEIM